jgi:hypothetical protein
MTWILVTWILVTWIPTGGAVRLVLRRRVLVAWVVVTWS